MTSPQTRPAFFRSRSHRLGGLVVAIVFGLLLWAKLLLVTNHPRTAIADPEPPPAPTAPATPAAPAAPAAAPNPGAE